MNLRVALCIALVGTAQPCAAEKLLPDAVRDFVAGKLFAFNCFEGTQGSGRIYDDGSVAGTIQIRGVGAPRYVVLPPGTLRVKGESYCASVPPIPFEPCFEVDRLTPRTFRGAVLGFDWAFCHFTKEPPITINKTVRAQPSQPLSLSPRSYSQLGNEHRIAR